MFRLYPQSKFIVPAARSIARFNSTASEASKNDPLSILSNMAKGSRQNDKSNSLFSFLDDSSLSTHKNTMNALDFAKNLPLADKTAGRTLLVRKSSSFNRSLSQFDTLVRANNLKNLWYDQRFYTKPNKRRLAKRIANKKKRFDSGIAQLFDIVKDAVRKGY